MKKLKKVLSPNNPAIVELAKTLCATEDPTILDKSLALLLYRATRQVRESGEKFGIFTLAQLASVYKPTEYQNGTRSEREGIKQAVKTMAPRLATMSSRSGAPFCIVPGNDLLRGPEFEQFSKDPSVEAWEKFARTHAGFGYTCFYVSIEANGEIAGGYAEWHRKRGQGLDKAGLTREEGWAKNGALGPAALQLLGFDPEAIKKLKK